MGREVVFQKIRKQSKKTVIGGSILVFLGMLSSLFFVLVFEGINPLHIFTIGMLAGGIAMIAFGAKIYSNPMSSKILKKNPQLLMQADELFSDVLYQDDYIIFSNRVIANKKDVTQMAYLYEILWIYESKSSYNFVTTEHDVVIVTLNHTMKISIYGSGKQATHELLTKIYQLCPNARVGYTQENMAYCNQLKQANKSIAR